MPGIDPVLAEEIDTYLDPQISESELYMRLSDSAGLGADEIDKEGDGRVRFSAIVARHKQQICNHPAIAAYIRDPDVSDATNIAAQIVNVLLMTVPGVNVVIIACLIVRIGLRRICASSAATGTESTR